MILSVLEECYSAVRGVLVPYVRRVVLMSGSEFVTVSFGLKPGQPTLDLSFPLSIPPPSLSLSLCARSLPWIVTTMGGFGMQDGHSIVSTNEQQDYNNSTSSSVVQTKKHQLVHLLVVVIYV